MRRGRVFLLLCLVAIFTFIFNIFRAYQTVQNDSSQQQASPNSSARDDFKAFITSSYYYPESESLGDNALALVMTINQKRAQKYWWDLQWWNVPVNPQIVVFAKNSTDSVMVSTNYWKITPHEVCNMISIFASVQLIPNTNLIALVGDNGLVEIPFQTPPTTRRDVVVCISPLFISEQWQNFIFAAHIYKKFGAFMNLYLISAVDSFYHLMREYEKENYLTIQPWVSAKFIGVSPAVADPYNQIEFRNQASSQTDCLLKYKESAKYVTFLDLDDVLIPRLAPTYLEEINGIIGNLENIAYIHYHKENHHVATTKHGEKFSFSKMFRSLSYQGARETGKIVVDPRFLNYTWIHFPPFMPEGKRHLIVENNVITHLKDISWLEDFPRENQKNLPKFYDRHNETILDAETLNSIESDLQKMLRKPELAKILAKLPSHHFYASLIGKCYFDKYYSLHYSGRIKEITCPGPQLCEYAQRDDIKCIHVDATYHRVHQLAPISYFYATNPRFSANIGCYAH